MASGLIQAPTKTTAVLVAYLQNHTDGSMVARFQGAIAEVINTGGYIDSHAVADLIFTQRSATTPDCSWAQTRDYVQHLLREAAHVCRHAEGTLYRVHASATCSTTCDAIWAQNRPATAEPRAVCHSCFIELPRSGACGTCD